MEKSVKETVAAIVRSEVRKGRLGEMSAAMEQIPELFSSIEVDISGIQKEIRAIISRSGAGNPLNAILSLFGLRMVRPDCAEWDSTGRTVLRQCIQVDRNGLERQIASIGDTVAAYAAQEQERYETLREEYESNYQERNKLREEQNQERKDRNAMRREAAVSIRELVRITNGSNTEREEMLREISDMAATLGYRFISEPESRDDKNFDVQETKAVKKAVRQVGDTPIYVLYPALIDNEGGETLKGFAYYLLSGEEVKDI